MECTRRATPGGLLAAGALTYDPCALHEPRPMRLSEVLRRELVTTELSATDRNGVLRAIADRLAEAGAVSDGDAVFDALVAREESHTTAMGNAMAIPHCTIAGLDRPVLMVATSRDPVAFGDVPGEVSGDSGVRVFFVLLSPPGGEGTHIKLLARICRLARHAELLDGILGADSAGDVAEALLRVDGEHV